MGSWLAHMAALPRQRQIDSLWNRWVVASEGDEPARLVMRQLMCVMTSHVCCQPPSVSGRLGDKITCQAVLLVCCQFPILTNLEGMSLGEGGA